MGKFETNHFKIENIPQTLEVFGAHLKKAERKEKKEYFKILNGTVKGLNARGIGGGQSRGNLRREGLDILIPQQDPENIRDFYDEIILESRLEIDLTDYNGLKQFKKIVNPALNSMLSENFLRIANKYVLREDILRGNEAKTAYNISLYAVPESDFLTVNINPTHKMMYPLTDKHIKRIEGDEELDCRVIPRWSSGKIVGITEKRAKDTIEDSDKTYVEFWKKERGLDVDSEDKILKVRFDEGKSYKYPSSTLFREFSFDIRKNRNLSLSPEKRKKKSINFVRKYLKNLKIGPINVSLSDEPMDAEDLNWENIRYKDSRNMEGRVLDEDGNTKTCPISDVRKTLSNGYLPVNRKKDNKLILFVPEGFEQVDEFQDIIKSQYSYLNLGNLEMYEEAKEGPIYKCKRRMDSYKQKAEVAHKDSKGLEKKPIAIVVFPEGTSKDFFYQVRSVLHQPNFVVGENPIPTQYVEESTAKEIVLDEAFYEANNIVGQLYVKGSPSSPQKAIWTLSEHADRDVNYEAGTTCYASFDTSRHTELGSGASAYSAVSDSRGEYVVSGTNSFSGEKLTEKGFYQILCDLIKKISIRKDDFQRLVLFRDGRAVERDMMKKVIDRGIEEEVKDFPPLNDKLKRMDFAPDSLIIDVIFVNKSPVDRIFYRGKNNQTKNVFPGNFFKKSERSGLLISAEPISGTVRPLELNFGLRRSPGHDFEREKPSIDKLGEEYYRLTFLNWSSFHSQGKTAITQKLTQELGKNIARNVPTPDFTIYI